MSDGSFFYEKGDPESCDGVSVRTLKRRGIVGLFKITPKF
jgi:hypothetical protein